MTFMPSGDLSSDHIEIITMKLNSSITEKKNDHATVSSGCQHSQNTVAQVATQ